MSADNSSERDERPSKTQLKREVEELQALGAKLIDMSDTTLERMEIDAELMDAIHLARKIRNKREAYRRQLQFIGKLMRGRDVSKIQESMLEIEQQGLHQNAHFHQLEKWRDKLIAGGDDAVQDFIEAHPFADRTRLRQLIRQAQKEKAQNKPPKSARELFKYIREVSEF